MEWRVQLSGDKSDLEELSKSLNSDDLKIWENNGKYILSSSDFNSLNEAQDVRDNAEIKLNYINGCSKLKQAFQQPITIDGIESLSEDGKRNQYIFVPTASMVLRTYRPTVLINGKEEGTYIYEELGKYILLAMQDKNVAEVLNCLKSEEDDPRILYNILEIIREDVGGEKNICDKGWASSSKIRLFRQTINITGERARHLGDKYQPPKNPMSLDEAKYVILHIVKCWLDSKLNNWGVRNERQ